MADDPLLTLEESKDLLGIPQTSTINDARITMLLPIVTKMIENYIGRALFEATFTKQFWGGLETIFLENYPVASITSIADPGSNTVGSDFYVLRGEVGILHHTSRFPRATDSNGKLERWTITYVGGRFATAAAVTSDYKGAAAVLLADMYNRPEPMVRSVGQGRDIKTDYFRPNDLMPPEVQRLIGGDVSMY